MSTIESIRKELQRQVDINDATPGERALLAVLDAPRFDITAFEYGGGVINYDETPDPDGEYLKAKDLHEAILRAWDGAPLLHRF